MLTEKHTVIVTTPEELLPLLMEAIRAVEEERKTDDVGSQGKRLLSPKDVEYEFGIHRKMLAEWRAEGIGPAYTTFGRRILYERAVVENYIISKRIKTSGYSGI
ncbi:hypothetical protein [Desulfovibrio sp. SGI.169]|uniref:hypothetical protein n=1 Tax=Desulfovibrio sp. SGI.169 TaxID=3420561 RepID=UPI003D082283